jgi:hypothetical protein
MGLNNNAATHLANKEIVIPTTIAPDNSKNSLIQLPVEHQLGQKGHLSQDKMIFYGE